MNIAILGGSFDPPHLGHLLIARQVVDFSDADLVWLTPCFRHTFDKSLSAIEHRVTMTKMLIEAKIDYCGEEIDNRLSGDSIDLMDLLKRKYPQHRFSFIIGSDNLAGFTRWGRWKELVSQNDFFVFPRPGFSARLSDYGFNHSAYRFHTVKHPLLTTLDISSSYIRKRIKKHLPIAHLVPEKVNEYIVKNKLYQ